MPEIIACGGGCHNDYPGDIAVDANIRGDVYRDRISAAIR